MPWTFESSRVGYRNLWLKATVKPGADDHSAETFAGKIIAAEPQYRAVQAATGVPWFFIGALHMRESSCNFAGVLHNGEKIIGTGRLTTLHPPGVGPFATWEESAIHALKSKNLHRVQEWSIERMLYSAEEYNGWGYAGKVNSPYVWAGTTQEERGKYIRDHVFDPNAEDTQLGVAAVLKRLAEKRPDIAAALQPESQPAELPRTEPEILTPLLPGKPLDPIAFLTSALALFQKAQQPGGLQQQDLLTFLQPLIQGAGGQATPQLPPPIVQPVQPPKPDPAPKPPMTERPSFLIGMLGLVSSAVAMLNGNIPPPVGETATLPSILSLAIPGATALLGGPIWSVVSGLFKGYSITKKPS